MASDFGGRVDLGGFDYSKLEELSRLLDDSAEREKKAAEEVFNYKLSLLQKEVNRRQEVQNELARLGYNNIKAESEERIKALKKEKAARLAIERKANGGASSAEYKALKKQIDAEYKLKEDKEKKLAEKKAKFAAQYEKSAQRQANIQQHREDAKHATNNLFGKGKTWAERKAGAKELVSDPNKLIAGLADLAKQLENQVDNIANKKSFFDTRLQGSKNKKMFGIGGGSYWDQMSYDIMGVAGVSPLVKQESVVSNLETLVGKGIAYNVEQRAFLATISDKIANTFNVADATLLRLVRIQQQDSTASRLGMESMITSFLNNMYETTEYLSDLASSVRSSLDEVESLMGAADAVALEYQVQKWMGSLYSVGMSQSAVTGIASAFGKLAAGDISGLTGSGMGNLMIMAANQAGLSIADILADGIDDSDTNKLMNAMVEYLQQIAISSEDSRVVQQQIAKVYGLTASDLRAAKNIGGTKSVFNSGMSYQGGINQLYNMANSMYARTSMGEMMSNVWSNFQYTMAAGMASNPVTYLLYKTASLLDSVAGGIALPDIKVMGSGVNLQTTVADLMRVASMSGGVLAGLGSMISNLGAAGGFNPGGMLKALGITGKLTRVERGGGYTPVASSGSSLSESGSLVGNSDSNAVLDKTLGDASDEQESKMAEAKADENNDLMNKDLNDSILKIYDLLGSVITGASSIKVTRADGLPWSTSSASSGLPGMGG